MERSLWNISEDIEKIFTEVENQEGEITDGQYEELIIKEEELKEKLNQYYKLIKYWETDATLCKEESKRIKLVETKYKNRVARLKQAMVYAVQQFGTQGKTNKYIELPTVRLFTKNSKSVEINENRINLLINELRNVIHEYVTEVDYVDELNVEDVLSVINANLLAADTTFIPFTINDLLCLQLNISMNVNIEQLFKNSNLMINVASYNLDAKVENATPACNFKNIIDLSDTINDNNFKLTIAEIKNNISIQMK